MSNSYVFPGGVSTYVPSLSADLVVEFSRNPNKFPLALYCDYRNVDKQKGYYVKMLNNAQGMVLNDGDNVWADGNDSPHWIDGTDEFTFPQFNCLRRRLPKMLGSLAVEQAGWDILGQASRLLAQQMMTARVKRIHSVLTASANWGANYATATTAGGGVWASAGATTPYIRKSLAYARILIEQGTYGNVTSDDLFLIMNPNVAKVVALSQEFLDFQKESPQALPIWEGQKQYQMFGIPEYLMGLRTIVDNTVYTGTLPSVAPSFNFTLSDSYVVLMSKQKAISPSAGGAFSTFSPFLYEDMAIEVLNDPENRRYKVFCTENIDDTVNALVAPQSGFLIKIDS